MTRNNTTIGITRISAATLGLALFASACSDTSATDDIGTAGTAGAAGEAGAAGDAGSAGDSGSAGDGGNAGETNGGGAGGSGGTGDDGFSGDPGLPDAGSAPWGPNFIGVQNAVDEDEERDIGFAVFWEPEEVWVLYVDDHCMGYGTYRDERVGRDVGTITITGGSLVASQDLTLNDTGYYYLDGGENSWAAGDSVSADVDGYAFDSVEVPTPAQSPELEASTTVSRSSDFEFAFSGSDATNMAATISSGNDDIGYMLVCIVDASPGSFKVPAAAWASFPAGLEGINFKLTPANLIQDADVALIAAGEHIELSLTLED